MPKEISLKLSLATSKESISISHEFEKGKKHPYSLLEIENISFTDCNSKLLKDLQLLDAFNISQFKLHITDSFNLCSPSFIKEAGTNEYITISDGEFIFGELDFHSENIEINIWWIINNQSKFSAIKDDLIQSACSTFEISIPQDFIYDIKKNANFFFNPNRIKIKSHY
jgi:hypothetical protein